MCCLDFTTIAFATISVCSLDYIIIFEFFVRCLPLSLYTLPLLSRGLARYCHHHYVLRFHRIREVLLKYFYYNAPIEATALSIKLRGHLLRAGSQNRTDISSLEDLSTNRCAIPAYFLKIYITRR